MSTNSHSILEITNPSTHEAIAFIDADNEASVRAKFRSAQAAQPAWAAVPLAEKIAVLSRFREKLLRQAESLAITLTAEVGKPIRQSRAELNGVLGRIDFFLQEAPAALQAETVFAAENQDGSNLVERITHEPLGVIANISAWNYPYFIGCNVFIPALLTGNAVLYKPSEFATLSGLAMARLLHESGVPHEVFVPIVGTGETGKALVQQSIDAMYFTGSVATGRQIAGALAGRTIKVQLELGGKDPVYVCDDIADVDRAAASVADGAFYNAGQSCCSVERIYVHQSIFAQFVAAFVAEVNSYKLGDPMLETTYIGPLTRNPQFALLESQVAEARAKGARLLTGGKRAGRRGNYFQPTVLIDVDHSMSLMREESFGPVVGIVAVKSDDEAVALMNDTDFGLTAGVYTRDQGRAERILARVNSGSAYWNCCDRVSPRLPWSGWKDSGIGLTLSREGILAFTRPKAWHLKSF